MTHPPISQCCSTCQRRGHTIGIARKLATHHIAVFQACYCNCAAVTGNGHPVYRPRIHWRVAPLVITEWKLTGFPGQITVSSASITIVGKMAIPGNDNFTSHASATLGLWLPLTSPSLELENPPATIPVTAKAEGIGGVITAAAISIFPCGRSVAVQFQQEQVAAAFIRTDIAIV